LLPNCGKWLPCGLNLEQTMDRSFLKPRLGVR
jgi:hypothetical protein